MSQDSPRSLAARHRALLVLSLTALLGACSADDPASPSASNDVVDPALDLATVTAETPVVDEWLRTALRRHGFTGRVGQSLEARLGRPVSRSLANTGRLLFFDPLLGLNDDNSCSGCHSPAHAFGDAGSIAIGIGNNGVVGPSRTGPRNQRRTPNLSSITFAPKLMWNGRFSAGSGDPFDNAGLFHFPAPEGTSLSYLDHLLDAQAFIPPTERVEMAGFAFPGNNFAIRDEVVRRVNGVEEYVRLLGEAFPDVRRARRINYNHLARAIAEFEFSLTRMNAPIDRFARGHAGAMSREQKLGAVLFFGKARCAGCHTATAASGESFSDFENHVIGVPQVVPTGTNVLFDGPGHDEDFGMEQISGRSEDRYKFRTSPLRNVAVQPSFMHNGAFTRLEDAVRHHFNVRRSALGFTTAHLPPDLQAPMGPMVPVLERVSARLRAPIQLSDREFEYLVEFVRVGLLDPDATPERMRALVPTRLPSGRPVHRFEFPTPAR